MTTVNFRLSGENLAKLDELARKLSPIPLNRSQVLRLAIDRLYEQECRKARKEAKK